LESGEFLKVGSSKVQKTDVRIVAATNVNIPQAIANEKFREDLYYRLNTVPINIPPLRERKDDIHLFFRKFALDFADKYKMPGIRLTEEAQEVLTQYYWPGNVRQIKNVAEQVSVIEEKREVSKETLLSYLPAESTSALPVLFKGAAGNEDLSERDILYKVLFDMKADITDLKKLVFGMLQEQEGGVSIQTDNSELLNRLIQRFDATQTSDGKSQPIDLNQMQGLRASESDAARDEVAVEIEEIEEESLSLRDNEVELIGKALLKHKSNKNAAAELGISERTLYRKIKEYNIKD
jgi:transcriptional regulator with PAS, ATPase and Fis domain